jgi:hypothetical protein
MACLLNCCVRVLCAETGSVRGSSPVPYVWSMASGEMLPANEMRACHIRHSKTAGEGERAHPATRYTHAQQLTSRVERSRVHVCVCLFAVAGFDEFGLHASDVHNPRNGLLLPPLVETFFDNKCICLLWDWLHGGFIWCVSHPDLLKDHRPIAPSSEVKLSELHGRRLSIPSPSGDAASAAASSSVSFGPLPFRRLLSFHAQLCYDYAVYRGWELDALPEAPEKQWQDWPGVFEAVTKLSSNA